MRALRKASRGVRARPGETEAAGVHEVRRLEGEVRVAGGGGSGSGGGQRERQGEREGGGDFTARRRETEEEEDDDDEIVEVAGPSGSRSGFSTGPFLERMDRLTAAVEAMTGQMARIADSTRSVSRSNDRLSAGLETFFEECRFFTSEFVVSEEESEEEVDPEEIDQELEGLQRDLEEQEGPAPE